MSAGRAAGESGAGWGSVTGVRVRCVALAAATTCLSSAALSAQSRAFDSVAVMVEKSYSVTPNVVYRTTGGVDLRLDLYLPRRVTAPAPRREASTRWRRALDFVTV